VSGRASTLYLSQLHRLIDQHFDREELRLLCFDLDVDYDNLRGETKATAAMDLVRRLHREKRLEELVDRARDRRPNVLWPTPLAETPLLTRSVSSRWIGGGAAVALLFIVFFVAYVLLQDDSREQPTVVPADGLESEIASTLAAPVPTPLYGKGLITYVVRDAGGSKDLHAVQPDGSDVTLFEGAAGILVAAISPDQRYLAVAVSQTAELMLSRSTPRFISSSAFDEAVIELWVTQADGGQAVRLLEQPVCFLNAVYTAENMLLTATLGESADVIYHLADEDGRNVRVLYRSSTSFDAGGCQGR